MKILSRLKIESDTSEWWGMPDDDYDFWYEYLPNFSKAVFDIFWDCSDTKDAEKFLKDAELKFNKFVKDEAEVSKSGKPSNPRREAGEKDFRKKLDNFERELREAKSNVELFNSVSLGDSVEKTFSKLKSAFKNKDIAEFHDFPSDFDKQYEKFHDEKDDTHTIKLCGGMDFYLQFKDGKLENKYF